MQTTGGILKVEIVLPKHELIQFSMVKLRMQKFQNDSSPTYNGELFLNNIEVSLIGYNSFIANKFMKAFKTYSDSDERNVLDFGAGIGTLSEIFAARYQYDVTCVELDIKLRNILLNKGFSAFSQLREVKLNFNKVFTSNVLEHIENDVEVLTEIGYKMDSGGVLCIFVPAFQILYSDFDASIGHVRRYTKKELQNKLQIAEFQILSTNYVDSLGFIITFLLKKLKLIALVTKSTKTISLYDKLGFPISRVLDNIGLRFLFGKNIFIVARRK